MLLLLACTMDDNSLEPATLDPLNGKGDGAGALAVAEGTEAGDWELDLDEEHYTLHSPSHADLGAYADLEVQLSELGGDGIRLDGPEGALYAYSDSDSLGRSLFGRNVWEVGDVLGEGTQTLVYPSGEEESEQVTFVAVDVAADDGTQTFVPAVPQLVTIDGVEWRMTILGAYKPHAALFSGCAMTSIIEVELARTSADPGPALVRPDGLNGIYGSCG